MKYTDRGHKLHALFYSPAGDAMQLRDRAQLEMQVIQGDSVIDREDINVEYIVLMTRARTAGWYATCKPFRMKSTSCWHCAFTANISAAPGRARRFLPREFR